MSEKRVEQDEVEDERRPSHLDEDPEVEGHRRPSHLNEDDEDAEGEERRPSH
jgi:hypothetical protein